MNVSDLVEVELANGVRLFWEVTGIYLGAENQESVAHLVPIDQSANTQNSATLVPCQLIDAAITPGCSVRVHSTSVSLREKELIGMLMNANGVLRSCMEVINRRGDATNWDSLRSVVGNELNTQHKTLLPIKYARLRAGIGEETKS